MGSVSAPVLLAFFGATWGLLGGCCELNVSSPRPVPVLKSYTSNVMVFAHEAFERSFGLDEVMKVPPPPAIMGLVSL